MTELNNEMGKEVAVTKTIFLYKVNVAVAIFLIVLNIQALVTVLLAGAPIPQIVASLGLLAGSVGYCLLAVNGYMSKIILHEKGLILKSLLSEQTIEDEDIASVYFHRVNMKKLVARITLKTNKAVVLRSNKYQNFKPIVEYLQQFKK